MSSYFVPVQEQLAILGKLIQLAKMSLADKPKGSVFVQHSHTREQYYLKDSPSDRHGRYLRKSESALAKALIQKDYDQRFLKEAERIYHQLQSLSKKGWETSASFMYETLGRIYGSLSGPRQKLVTPYVLPEDLFVKAWIEEPYEKMAFHPEDPEIFTERGQRVRSKSEKMIADKHDQLGIPFKYECPTHLKGLGRVFTDFQALDVRERVVVYEEHFGLMNDPVYCLQAIKKIACYQRSGLIAGDRFLFTMEGGRYTLDLRDVERALSERFKE